MSPVVVALDFDQPEKAISLAERIDPEQCRLKVGKELFTVGGPALVDSLQKLGFDVFLDLKFHDIPNTVAKACAAAASLGVWMLNVHCSGGSKMMQAAREAIDGSVHKPLLIGVTVLTSSGQQEMSEINVNRPVQDQVLHLAALANKSGLDGVVCSAQEAAGIKVVTRPDFVTVTPGIRPEWAAKGDQNRIMTPKMAVENKADYLVIGRPVTQADDPLVALEKIIAELAG